MEALKQNKLEEDAALALRRQRATQALFFISGFGVAAWAPLVPFVKNRLGVAEDMLGVLLLCIGIGSVVAMPLAGAAAARFGCRAVLTAAGSVLPALLLLLSVVPSLSAIVLTLLAFGAVVGAMDATVSIQAVLVEKASGKRLMSGMHALWSIGGFAGAGLFGVLMQAGLSPVLTTACNAAIIWAILAAFFRNLLPYGGEGGGSPFAAPKGIVALIGGMCFISFLAEGAVLDWSGIFLTSLRGVDLSLSGIGYAVFSIAMLIARLVGDRIVQQFDERRIVVGGALIAAGGFALTILAENAAFSFLGFFLVGAGAANIVPILFSLLGRQTVMPVNAAVSAVTMIGYSGILMGPAAIGFIAHQIGLLGAFGLLAALILCQTIMAKFVYGVMGSQAKAN